MPTPQTPRHIAIETSLGENVLLLQRFSGHEGISCLFEFDLHLLSEDYDINFDDIIGQNVTVRLDLPNGTRYWNGYISRFMKSGSGSQRFAEYRATMVPWLWFLTRTSDCRIFQDKTVPEIIRQVFSDLGYSDIEDRLSGSYRTWTYCVQYRETDFNFVSRLMEQEGIYYYFLHDNGTCTLVLCDSLSRHDAFTDYEEIGYFSRATSDEERITGWTVEKRFHSGKFAHTDYNFEKPTTSLMSPENEQRAYNKPDYEIYDYPGEYFEKVDGEQYARVRMEELARSYEVCSGKANARGICPGYLFTMTVRDNTDRTLDDQAREYLAVSAGYHAFVGDYETSGGIEDEFGCTFTAIPSSVQFRPARITPKPSIEGSQTAFVTGPPGEEIHTDKHGRIKVQFHWDREGRYDGNSSCWIRVSQGWAGKGWGSMFIPRIGQEVIVNFLEGDPDRPIVTGCVYHGSNTPPYTLPDEKTKSTIKSMSSPDRGGVNEIRFEDKAGNEQLFFHAEKVMDYRSKDKSREYVGGGRHLIVAEDQYEKVSGDKHLTVKGDHNEKVSGTISIQNEKGDILQKSAMSYAVDAGGEIHIKGGMKVVIEAGTQLSLKTGGNFIDIGPAGVSITGAMVKINSGGAAGSGSGCSPEAPTEPEAADETTAGSLSELPSPLSPGTMAAQASSFELAAASGAPFCDT